MTSLLYYLSPAVPGLPSVGSAQAARNFLIRYNIAVVPTPPRALHSFYFPPTLPLVLELCSSSPWHLRAWLFVPNSGDWRCNPEPQQRGPLGSIGHGRAAAARSPEGLLTPDEHSTPVLRLMSPTPPRLRESLEARIFLWILSPAGTLAPRPMRRSKC